MITYKSSSVKSKWRKTKWLLQQPDLRRYVPRTMLFTRKNLNTMLSTYKTVFFKPTDGSGGSNIIKIKRKAIGFRTQLNREKATFETKSKLYKELSQFADDRSFLLQKGIQLAKTKGRPFDIRVMVQKTNAGEWVSTGLFTKIGQHGKVATNYHQGGRVGYFQPTLASAGYSQATIREKEKELEQLGVTVGHNFEQHISGFRELGLDVALDTKGRSWILEVNTRPEFYPLKKMKNRKLRNLYQTMARYGKQYGRRK